MNKILVTGGAGYIGSHAVKALVAAGFEVTVLDNLSAGNPKALPEHVKLVHLDLTDRFEVENYFELLEQPFDAVMHFAGRIEAGLSMVDPDAFFQANVVATFNLLEMLRRYNIGKLVFSSTAAVYGDPVNVPIKETDPTLPTNFYGTSKLTVEHLIRDYGKFFGLKSVMLRYFNAAGADESGKIGECHMHETHLIPRLLQTVLGQETEFKLFGTDYPTADGTCIRDYIHVSDLADAHVLALKYLLKGGDSDVFNLGNGGGFSVREVLKTVEKVTGKTVPVIEEARRAGDPSTLIADASRAKEVLGWKPTKFELEKIVADAWRWHQANPNGY